MGPLKLINRYQESNLIHQTHVLFLIKSTNSTRVKLLDVAFLYFRGVRHEDMRLLYMIYIEVIICYFHLLVFLKKIIKFDKTRKSVILNFPICSKTFGKFYSFWIWNEILIDTLSMPLYGYLSRFTILYRSGLFYCLLIKGNISI